VTAAAKEDAYLGAFLNGLEFALLAMEGRLPKTRENAAFLADYWDVLRRFREGAEPADAVRLLGPVVLEAAIEGTARN
jgi:hypothetical protein